MSWHMAQWQWDTNLNHEGGWIRMYRVNLHNGDDAALKGRRKLMMCWGFNLIQDICLVSFHDNELIN